MSRYCLSLLCASAVVAARASAEEPFAPTNQPLPEVVVTATRLPGEQVAVEKYPANVTVLTRKDIQESPATTLPDLLRQQTGLTPVDTVGFGQSTLIGMRGFGDRNGALILVDGVRVNDAGDSTLPYLWNTIPLADIERIEVIRGGASTTYGEGAIGGVINIITKKPADKLMSVETEAAGGNLGYYSSHAEVSGRTNWFNYVASGGRQEWEGWRDGSAFRSWTALVKPGFDTPAGRFTFSYNYHWESAQNPGNLTTNQFRSDPDQKGANTFLFDNTIHRGALDYVKSWDNGVTLLGKAFGQTFDDTSESAFGMNEIHQPNYGGTLQASWRDELAGHDNELTVGTEGVEQDFRAKFSSSFGNFATDADNWTTSGFVQDNFAITKKLNFSTGLRFDHRHWDVFSTGATSNSVPKQANVWSPKAGLTYEWMEKVSSWVELSSSYRLPTGYDIGAAGSVPGQTFNPNPSISPTESQTIETGIRSDRWNLLGGSLAYFYSDVRRDIVFDPIVTFENRNYRTTHQGVELSMYSKPVTWMDVYFNAAYTDAHFDSGPYDGSPLPLVPEWQLSGGTHWRPIKGLTTTLEAVHVDQQVPENDVNNAFRKNYYTVVNARVDYQWRNLGLFASVNNLFNTIYQQFPTVTAGAPVRAFDPAPGINYQMGAKLRF